MEEEVGAQRHAAVVRGHDAVVVVRAGQQSAYGLREGDGTGGVADVGGASVVVVVVVVDSVNGAEIAVKKACCAAPTL